MANAKLPTKQAVYEACWTWEAYPDDDDRGVVRRTKRQAVEVKRSFFYRHGQTAKQWAEQVARAFPEQAVAARDDWREWPANSYFVAVVFFGAGDEIKLEPGEVLVSEGGLASRFD